MVEGGFAEVRLGKSAPDLHLGNVRDVFRDYDRFLDLLTFRHQPVQEISLPVRVHDLPMRIGCLRWDEVVGERESALAVCRRVGNETLVCFCALERATLMVVLGNAACCSDNQRGYGSDYGFTIHAPFVAIGAKSLQFSDGRVDRGSRYLAVDFG
jgi:hypothetical protein